MADGTFDPELLKNDDVRASMFGVADAQETTRLGIANRIKVAGEKLGIVDKPIEIGDDQKAAASKIAAALNLSGQEQLKLTNSLTDRNAFNRSAPELLSGLRKNGRDDMIPELRGLLDDVNEVADYKESAKANPQSASTNEDDFVADLEADYKDVDVPKVPQPNAALPADQQWKALSTDLQSHNQQWTVERYKNLGADQLRAMEDVFVAQNINWMKNMLPEGYSPLPKENLDSYQAGILLQKYREAKNKEGTSALTPDQAQLLHGMKTAADYIKTKEITPYGGTTDVAYDAANAAMNTLATMEAARLQVEGKTVAPTVAAKASPTAITSEFNTKATEVKEETPATAFNSAVKNEVKTLPPNLGIFSPHYTVPQPHVEQPQRSALSYLENN